MYVHAAQGWDLQILLGEDLAKGCGHHQIRGKRLQRRHPFRATDLFELIDGNPIFLRQHLGWGRRQISMPSLGPVRIGEQGQGMPLIDQHLERGDGEIRCA